MSKKYDWQDLVQTNDLHIKRTFLNSIRPNALEYQKELINWFCQSKYIEVRINIFEMISYDSKFEILKINGTRNKDYRILNFLSTLNDEVALKNILIDFFLIQNHLDGNRGILWIIHKYMLSLKCSLGESRDRIEPMWNENMTLFKKKIEVSARVD